MNKTLMSPIWVEGIPLHQQHLQALEDDYLARSRFYTRLHEQDAWGLLTFAYDQAKLEQGELDIECLKLIFASGEIIQWSQHGDQSLRLILDDQQIEQTIYIGLARASSCTGLPGYVDRGKEARWKIVYQNLSDSYREDRFVEVAFKQPLLQLNYKKFDETEYELLPLMRVSQVSPSRYRVDEQFIAPCLSLAAMPCFRKDLERIQLMLRSRIKHYRGTKQARALLAELLQLKGQVSELVSRQEHHPKDAFYKIKSGVDRLSVYTEEPFAEISYSHIKLDKVWSALYQYAERVIMHIEIKQGIDSQLERVSKHLWLWRKPTQLSWQRLKIIVMTDLNLDDQIRIARFKKQIKITSQIKMPQLLTAALPGIALKDHHHPVDEKCTLTACFKLDPHSQAWQGMQQDNTLALFLPDEFHEMELALSITEIKQDAYEKEFGPM